MHNKSFPSQPHRGTTATESRAFPVGSNAGNIVAHRRRNGRTELTDEQKQEVKDGEQRPEGLNISSAAFELFDEHKSGKIDYHELKVGYIYDSVS